MESDARVLEVGEGGLVGSDPVGHEVGKGWVFCEIIYNFFNCFVYMEYILQCMYIIG